MIISPGRSSFLESTTAGGDGAVVRAVVGAFDTTVSCAVISSVVVVACVNGQ